MPIELRDALRRLSDSQQPLPAAVLLHGSEPLLVEEALDHIRTAVKKRGFDQRTTFHQDAGFDWAEFYSQVRGQGSLFAQQNLYELRANKALSASATKQLNDYLEDPSQEDLLLLIIPPLEKRQLSAKWLKIFEQSGWHITIPAVPPYKLADWIKQRLQSRSLRVEPGVVEVLLENVEGNLLAAAQEIDKLQVLCPDGALTLDTLNRCLADQAKYDAFNLVDVCLKGNQQKALRILDRLQQEGVEPVVVLWALVREVRKLTAVSAMLRSGLGQAEAYRSQQIWRSRESLVGGVLRRINYSQWLSLLDELAKLDQSIKGQRYDGLGTSWQQLRLFCSQLSGGEQRTIFAA